MYLVQMKTQIKQAGTWIMDSLGNANYLNNVMTDIVEMIFQWYYLQDKVDNRLVYTMLCFGTQLLKKFCL